MVDEFAGVFRRWHVFKQNAGDHHIFGIVHERKACRGAHHGRPPLGPYHQTRGDGFGTAIFLHHQRGRRARLNLAHGGAAAHGRSGERRCSQ